MTAGSATASARCFTITSDPSSHSSGSTTTTAATTTASRNQYSVHSRPAPVRPGMPLVPVLDAIAVMFRLGYRPLLSRAQARASRHAVVVPGRGLVGRESLRGTHDAVGADHRAVRRNVAGHDRIGTDDRAAPHPYCSQDLRARSDVDIVPDHGRGMHAAVL